MTVNKANPYSPGAGHSPPYLAGREAEIEAFRGYLEQDQVRRNVILTGLRGTGKTVLMDDKYKPIAQQDGWVWVGSDFSESTFLSEVSLCVRILTDLSVFSSSLRLPCADKRVGFDTGECEEQALSFELLAEFLASQPGLTVDKLKATLELVWVAVKTKGIKGVVFAYDEAQVVADKPAKEQYPLAVLLETFQSLQRKGVKFLLLLTGLPTLFPRLVESRTYAERMFTVQELGRLSRGASREAIENPLKTTTWLFAEEAIRQIIEASDGYPYFIQFICREILDYVIAYPQSTGFPMKAIIRKLDSDFFAGRWDSVTDRQRELLYCIAHLDHADNEFTIGEIVDVSKKAATRAFSPNDVSQMLPRLIDKGLIYKNRTGKYCFAVPLFSSFIRRRFDTPEFQQKTLFE